MLNEISKILAWYVVFGLGCSQIAHFRSHGPPSLLLRSRMDPVRLGKEIETRRKERGFTLEALAELTKLSVSTILSVEQATHPPRSSTVLTILEILGTDLLDRC